MVGELTETVIRTIQDAAKRLTGAERRKFEAQVARDYCQGSARKAETIFRWGRVTVQTGLDERQTGIPRENRYSDRGRRKAEDKLPSLEEDIRKLLEPQSQTDPKFQSMFLYTRATGQAVREALLLRDDVYTPEDLPSGANDASSDEPVRLSAATGPKSQAREEDSGNGCHLRTGQAGPRSVRSRGRLPADFDRRQSQGQGGRILARRQVSRPRAKESRGS